MKISEKTVRDTLDAQREARKARAIPAMHLVARAAARKDTNG